MILSSRNSATRTLAALAALASACLAQAQGGPLGSDSAIPATPAPVGSGARAAGMGNTFVAIADDATAVSWNPAGLVQLEEPEFSIVGQYLWTGDDFTSWHDPEANGEHSFDNFDLNFLSFVYPVPRPVWNRNLVLSLSYQKRYDFTRNLDANLHTSQSAFGGLFLRQDTTLDFDQEGSLGAISLAAAYEITNTLSVGVALNLWRDTFIEESGWQQETTVNSRFTAGSALSFSRGYSREEYENFRGENLTLGALWRANDKWTLGLRYETAFTGDVDYDAVDWDLRIVPNPLQPFVSNFAITRERREVRFPDTLALGVAYRRNDRLTFALDISRTDWNDLTVKTGRGDTFSLVDGADLGNPYRRTHFDPTYAVRLGTEYAFIPKQRGETLDHLWTLRGGVFMEQEPASGRSSRNFFRPGDGNADEFYGVAAGLGLLLKQRVNIDLSYQYRWGSGVNGDLNPGVIGFDADEDSHRIMLSTVIYF